MTTLVTGATGLVGNNVLRLLSKRGEPVRVLVRKGSDPRPLAGLDVEVFYGDIRDAESVERASQGVRLVVHSAALVQVGWTGLKLQQDINVDGTRIVATAARACGARLVHVSSVDALGSGTAENPTNEETRYNNLVPCPYALTKRGSELEVLTLVAQGLDAVIVNPTFMIGPWDWKPSSGRMLLEVAHGRALVAPSGINNFCPVVDVAHGILAAAERGRTGERYILGGETLSYFETFKLFAEVTGARKPLLAVGPVILRVAGKFGDLRARLTGREGDVNSAATAMTQVPRYFSSARAERELNYRPKPFRAAAEEAWEWFQRNGYAKKKAKTASKSGSI